MVNTLHSTVLEPTVVQASLQPETNATPHFPPPVLPLAAPSADEKTKPRFRGIPDVVATVLALPAAVMLIAHARTGAHAIGALVYGVCLVALFAVSATYHTFMWPLKVRNILRRFDHSMVYILIAGSYTPMCLTVLDNALGLFFLSMVWGIALMGVIKSFVWAHAPRALNTAIYIGMGWLILPVMPSVYHGLGLQGFILLGVGGVVYTLGAVVYARRWPNPDPKIFGYHEVFHMFVIAAGACHYVTMWNLLT